LAATVPFCNSFTKWGLFFFSICLVIGSAIWQFARTHSMCQ
jgi:hypothetical protein